MQTISNWPGVLTLLSAVGLLSTLPATAENEIEEVVVTGSFIKRDNFDSASPLSVIDQVDLEAQATPSLGEVLANQTFNYGSDTFTNNYTARFQEGNATSPPDSRKGTQPLRILAVWDQMQLCNCSTVNEY